MADSDPTLDEITKASTLTTDDEIGALANAPAPKKHRGVIPEARLGAYAIKMAAGLAHDAFGLLTLPYTALEKNPNSFEKGLKSGGMALGASIPASLAGTILAGPIGGGVAGNLAYSGVADPHAPFSSKLAAGLLGAGLGALHMPASVESLVKDTGPGVADPMVSRLTEAMKAAGPIRETQESVYKAARAPKFQQAEQVRRYMGGEAGAKAAVGQMAGELPKVGFESVRTQFSQPEVDHLYDIIGTSNLMGGEKLTAESGLGKLLGIEAGQVPTKGELSILNTLYGKDFTTAALAKRAEMRTIGQHISRSMNVPRTLMTSYDLSAPGQQGLMFATKPAYWKALGPMVKSWKSEGFYNSVMDDIKARPEYELMRLGKLALPELGEASGIREEAFQASVAEKVPGVIQSERSYNAFLAKLRADVFSSQVKADLANGVSKEVVYSREYAEKLSKYVNTFSGRGNLPKFMKDWEGPLGTAMFSPKLQVARFELINPWFYKDLAIKVPEGQVAPGIQRDAITTGLKTTGSLLTLLGLASLTPGVKVSVDPRSADFGKIRFGDTRIDILGGRQQIVRLMAQLATDTVVSTTTGRVFTPDLHQLDILARYLEQKSSPVPSFVVGMLRHTNSVGEPFDASKEVLSRMLPMVWQDTWDAIKQYGAPGLALTPLAVFGVPTQTYHRQVKPFIYHPVEGKEPGFKITVHPDVVVAFADSLDASDKRMTLAAITMDGWKDLPASAQNKKLDVMLKAGRKVVERQWIAANADSLKGGGLEITRGPK